jgi:hypothetical protein
MVSKAMFWKNNFSLNELKDDVLISIFKELDLSRNDDKELMKLIILTLYQRKKLHLLNAA